MSIEITLETNLSKEDKKLIIDGLIEHASLEIGLSVETLRSKSFAFVVRIDGIIRAGLLIETFYQAVLMDTLWVDRSLRRQGIGHQLLKTAEEFAKSKGCVMAYLNTLSPANISFYEKAGYVFEFERLKYLGNFSMHYFRKELV